VKHKLMVLLVVVMVMAFLVVPLAAFAGNVQPEPPGAGTPGTIVGEPSRDMPIRSVPSWLQKAGGSIPRGY